MVNYKINVYLKHTEMENMYVREFIELVTQDINGNNFEFTIYEDEQIYDLTGKRVTLIVKSEQGTVIQENCQVVDAKQGKATITLPPDMLIENGSYMAEVQIWEGVNSRVTTLPFDYTVRLSLENDESIKADPRFSLLQVALKNVNDADNKSKEALKLSKEAKAICDDLVPKANTAAQNAQTALDRAESVVTQEELAQKVMLDGKNTNFDFIKNRVVQDGLIAEILDNTPKSMSIKRASHYTIQFVGKLDTAHPAYSAVFGMYSTSGETGYYYADAPNENSMNLRLRLGGNVYNGIDAHTNYKDLTNTMCNFLLDIDVENSITTLMINGVAKTFNQYESRPLDDTFTLYLLQTLIGGSKFKGEVKGLLVYDRALNQQEIQRNFSVLNNKPSIKELHTTDSTGKTSILRLASDTDHVEDRSGRTQDQINRTFYKRMCKEIPSPNGEPITVKNGEEGYVLSAEIKGQTVKNYYGYDNMKHIPPYVKSYDGWGTVTLPANDQYSAIQSMGNQPTVQSNTKYTVKYEMKNNTTNFDLAVGFGKTYSEDISGARQQITSKGEFTFSTPANSEGKIFALRIYRKNSVGTQETCDIKILSITLESEAKYVSDFINSGLSSTQTIVSNNGQQYLIYANEEDKANKKVILLGGFNGIYNTFEIKEDGSGELIENTKERILNGNETWSLQTSSNGTFICFKLGMNNETNGGSIMSNCFEYYANAWDIEKEGVGLGYSGNKNLFICISVSKLSTPDVTGFKQYLQANPLTVRYQLAASIITHIPKEVIPTILTHKTNILEVGGAVKPSSFKVTLPVDRIAELTARLEAVEAKTNTQPVNTAFVDETYAKSVNKIEEVIK